MPNLRPFRDYDEHDVINLFSVLDQSDMSKGTLLKLSSGWSNTAEPFGDTQDVAGSSSYIGKAVSNRYVVSAKVAVCGSGDAPLGIALFDVKENDENGEKLLFNPRKAAEMQVVISGQAMPIATRGMFLISGATLTSEEVTINSGLYADSNGEISPLPGSKIKIGSALGSKDAQDYVLIKLDCDPTRKIDGSN